MAAQEQQEVQLRTCTTTASSNRAVPWSDKEVKALIAVWGEEQELDAAVRNKIIFIQIS